MVHRLDAFSYPNQRPATLGGQLVERFLHQPGDLLVDRLNIGVWAEPPVHVDRLEYLNGDLGRQGYMPHQVADVKTPGQRQRHGYDLEAEATVKPKRPGYALTASEEQRRLLASDRHHRDDRHPRRERQPGESLAPCELDSATVPGGAVRFPVSPGVDEHRGSRTYRGLGVLPGGLDRSVLAQQRQPRRPHYQVVGQLEEGPLGTEAAVEGEREGESVRRDVPSGVIAHHQHTAPHRNSLQSVDVRAKPGRDQRPGYRERTADVVRIAML